MKVSCRSILFASLLGTLVWAPVAVAQIINPSFEQGWLGWVAGDKTGYGSSISDVAYDGDKSVKLTEKATFVSQVVTVAPQSHYQLTAYVRGAGSIGIKVGRHIFFEQPKTFSKDWQVLHVNFASEAHQAITVFAAQGKGEVRFDAFHLEKTDQPPQQTSARLISTQAGGYGLSPDVAPGRNFDLLDWYLNTPSDDDKDGKSDRYNETALARGMTDDRYFYTAEDGGMVMKATVMGAKTSANTKFTRTELREMLRRGDTSIKTKLSDGRPNKNNWVFSSASKKAQQQAGGVDGVLKATLAVNHVTTTGKPGHIGRVVIGQIHAKKDEPIRLYYRKLPHHQRGSLYAAHEPSGGKDMFVDLLGGRSNSQPDPDDGIALDEVFSYEIHAKGASITVVIKQSDRVLASHTFDIEGSGYGVDNDYMYFKAGVYNQNNSGLAEDYVQATFYQLENTHDGYP